MNPLKIETKISWKRFDGEITLKSHNNRKIRLLYSKELNHCSELLILEAGIREWFCVTFWNVTWHRVWHWDFFVDCGGPLRWETGPLTFCDFICSPLKCLSRHQP